MIEKHRLMQIYYQVLSQSCYQLADLTAGNFFITGSKIIVIAFFKSNFKIRFLLIILSKTKD